MILPPKVSGATLAYHLRHHKAIERNLFLSLLKQLNNVSEIKIKDYRYVGFGAAFLEDFKVLHSEFGISHMHCIEANKFVQTRQRFNKPYDFIELFPKTSTEYITSNDFKQNMNQIIWWDFAMPKQIRQQLKDAEFTGDKLGNLDILKFTFNIEPHNFQPIRNSTKYRAIDYKKALSILKEDATFRRYLPETITQNHLEQDLSVVLRAMCMRAVRRTLKQSNPDLEFYHLASFTYADGQRMTTLTGIICRPDELQEILSESGLLTWDFYKPDSEDEIITATDIAVPVMTIAERVEIDKRVHNANP